MISPMEGLEILKNWAIHKSQLSCISRGFTSPLGGPLSTAVTVEVAGSVLRFVPVHDESEAVPVDLTGVEFSSIKTTSRLILEMKFPGDGAVSLEQKLKGQ